jgi:hypothetical protein
MRENTAFEKGAMMTEKDLVNEGKEKRQETMDKLSIDSGKAYTYKPADADDNSGCVDDVEAARERNQQQMDKEGK